MNAQIRLERDDITALVISVLSNVLADRGGQPAEPLNENICLIGQGAVLNSLGLVTLLVDLEQRLEEDYGLALSLADERALSQGRSPFRTVRSLTSYISRLIVEISPNAKS